jgi:DNA-binding MarR family transcriptional regulator
MTEGGSFAQRLMQNMYRIARCRQATFQDTLSRYGVTLHQFHLLLHVGSGKKVKVKDVSDKMLVSMPTASRMINALCDLGMVSKEKGQGDKRSTYLVLTNKGRKVVEDIRKRQLETITRIMERIPDKDRDDFLGIMERIADNWAALIKEDEAEA